MSNPIVLKSPMARADLASCHAYIGERSLEAAVRFRLAVEATFAALARMPNTGALFEVENARLIGLRCTCVKRFRNHMIFYRPIDHGIEVIRILHAARDVAAILEVQE